jgi:hypothetical protein
MSEDYERVDADPNAETGDTRVRIYVGEHGTYKIARERYNLVKFPGPSDDVEVKEYDWSTEDSFIVRSDDEAKQIASALEDADAFDVSVLFFHELHPEERTEVHAMTTEDLARLAHRLWAHWSSRIATEEPISSERVERWRNVWRPFDDLTDDDQQSDYRLVERYLDSEPEYETYRDLDSV